MEGSVRRALFVVSDQGLGHKTRCGALADELRARGWTCEDRKEWQDSADVTIVDHPGLKARAQRVVYIVDEPGEYEGADLLVCGGAWATPEAFADSGAKKVLAGPQYALIRDHFRVARNEFDGAEPRGMGVFDARNIENVGPVELALKMLGADVIITYAGMRAMEAACVGAPMVLQARNEGERLNAHALMAAGAAVYVDKLPYPEGWASALNSAGHGFPPLMSAAGRALVDGLGTGRVADAIEAL